MSLIYIEIKANSPLALSFRHFVTNENNTLDYIPGSALRGAIAQKLLMELGEDHPEFKAIFIEGGIKFGNLYPGQGFPIPKSAKTCKYLKGFRGRRDEHGVFDYLLPTVKYKITEDITALPAKCPRCGAPIEAFSGFYKAQKEIDITKRLMTRTAIDERTLTAKDRFLYTLEAIEEDQEFCGIMEMEPSIVENEELKYKDISILKEGEMFWVGTGRTRGLGNIEIKKVEKVGNILPEELIPGNLKHRFNRMQEELSALNINGFSITLYSDVIAMDKFMRYKYTIGKNSLMEEFGLKDIEYVCAFNTTKEVLGWNAAWGLPKEKERAIEKGSVFFFKYNGDDVEGLLQSLKNVEMNGIGLRKEEGFGRVYICDSFHIDNVPRNWMTGEM
jgi:CRISPR-associated protein Csx10